MLKCKCVYLTVILHWNSYIISNIIHSFEISTYKKPSVTLSNSPLQVIAFELNVPHGKDRNLTLNFTEPVHSPQSSYGVNTGIKTIRLCQRCFQNGEQEQKYLFPP
uniref:Uncharacterized protein n=1 Tax=Sphaerodactylus townsendi TaxID=933632 RepID=A0ACB8G2D3_9SAUR